MAQVDSLDIQIVASSKMAEQSLDSLVSTLEKLRSQLGYSTESAKKFGNSSRYFNNLNNSLKSTSKHTFSLASAFGKFYANFFLVVRGMKSLWSSIGKTADYMEAFNYQNVALKKIAQDWKYQYANYGYENAEEYAESFSNRLSETMQKLSGIKFDSEEMRLVSTEVKNLGLNIQEVTQYASQLASVTNSVGQTGEVSIATATAFTKLAGDISSLFNVDYSTVAKNLQSGLIGQSRALYKYGIDITNATLQTYAYELGLSKAVSEMTQAEKMQLRIIAILDQSRVAWGDQANTILSVANQLRMLKNNLTQAAMTMGQLFIPILEKVLPFFNGLAIAITNTMTAIAGFFGIKIDPNKYNLGLGDMDESVLDLTNDFGNATKSAKALKGQLQGFDKLNVISTTDTSGASAGASQLGNTIDLTEQITKATQEYEKVWSEAYARMESVAGKWASRVEDAFSHVKKLFQDIAVGDWFAVGQDVSNIAVGILDFFSRAIESVDWKVVGENIGKFLNGIDWRRIIESAFDLGFNILEAVVEIWFESAKEAPFETILLTALGLNAATGIGNVLFGNMKNSIFEAFGSTPLLTLVQAVFGAAGGSSAASSALSMMFGELFAGAEAAAIGALAGLGVAIVGYIAYEVTTNWDKVKKAWTDAMDYLKKDALEIVDWVVDAKDAAIEVVTDGIDFIETKFKQFLQNVAYLFNADAWRKLFGSIKTGLSSRWQEAVNYWNSKPSLSKVSATVEDFKTKVVNAWNNLKTWWSKNAKLSSVTASIKLPRLSVSWDTTSKSAKFLQKLGLAGFPDFKVAYYANGGFPEDGWFRASHGEYFGKFDDGTSVIANNKQIISGIANGVKSANTEQNALLREQNELLRQLLQKDMGISSRDVFNAVRSENREYANRNGKSAFAY